MDTDNISRITVKGYHAKTRVYKLKLDFDCIYENENENENENETENENNNNQNCNSDNKGISIENHSIGNLIFTNKLERRDMPYEAKINEIESQKIYISWEDLVKSFKYVHKELNEDIYATFIYNMCSSIKIRDPNYRNTKEFIFGVAFRKNIRKITDVQTVLNYLLYRRNKNAYDKQAIDCILRHVFDIIG